MEDLLAALLREMADAVYVVDAQGRVRFVNPSALRVLGLTSGDEIIGRDSHAAIHHHRPDGTPFPEAECPLLRARDSGVPLRVEHDHFIRADGTFVPVAYSSAPVGLDGGRGAVVVFQDITHRLEAERHAEEAAAQRARTEELEASRRRIVEAEDRVRAAFERDLHDGGQQLLVRMLLLLQTARRDPAGAAETLEEATAVAQQALRQLRQLASGIDPAELREGGLVAALQELTAGLPLTVDLDVTDHRFGRGTERTAYFVVAEATANVLKHAAAAHVVIRAQPHDDELLVEVGDDGAGRGDRAEGGGLTGLRDRVAAVGGRFEVVPGAGGGTVVRAWLPR
jgi:PAS domain S-box-containing protein